jgi:hypothetical protein
MNIIKKKSITDGDIITLCKKLNVSLNDILMRDELTAKPLEDGNYILNLDTTNGVGTHWTAFHIDTSAKTIYYFDSFGEPCPNECAVAWAKAKFKIKCNATHIQDIKSKLCGFYAVYFLQCMENGAGISKLDKMKKCIKSFVVNDYEKDKGNDALVKQYLTDLVKK